MMFEEFANEISPPLKPMPPPGAVCPAIVRLLFADTAVCSAMYPPTSNTMMRFEALTASRNEPAPESASVVT